MDLYNKVKTSVMEDLINHGINKKEAEPKTFDVAGAFLPLSARTNVFWVGSIRTYITKIRELMFGDEESREIGRAMKEVFRIVCPNSMGKVEEDSEKRKLDFSKLLLKSMEDLNGVSWRSFNLKDFRALGLTDSEVCSHLGVFGSINASFKFDFRSIRDIHRHRAFFVNQVVNYKSAGIEPFYLDSIPCKKLREYVRRTLTRLLDDLPNIDRGEYGMPMGTKFSYFLSGTLDAWLYFLDLRSGSRVHPMVILLSQKIGKEFEKVLSLKNIYQRGGADYLKRSNDSNKI